ncbi:helix-turn-helix domain-containing protein [Bacillus cereus]|uniref:helix-turn-helix domain-containing protein n=1 Tax=Bacillus cereus TaxID=1396 RepID=UPI000BF86677|nr:helix-turn-helix transcriptional regulator [Bacillus cereus]PFN11866.1 transcriptional regulator [Bacillus cereus]PFS53495.1 transcriptional regulator [Bacillus cereus]
MEENIIGIRVKEIRNSFGYSQQTFADALDISKGMVSLIESGKKKPSRETVSKISNLTNISTDYIIGLSDNKTNEDSSSSDVMLELKHYIDRMESFDDETKEFAIKKIKLLISGLDIEGKK